MSPCEAVHIQAVLSLINATGEISNSPRPRSVLPVVRHHLNLVIPGPTCIIYAAKAATFSLKCLQTERGVNHLIRKTSSETLTSTGNDSTILLTPPSRHPTLPQPKFVRFDLSFSDEEDNESMAENSSGRSHFDYPVYTSRKSCLKMPQQDPSTRSAASIAAAISAAMGTLIHTIDANVLTTVEETTVWGFAGLDLPIIHQGSWTYVTGTRPKLTKHIVYQYQQYLQRRRVPGDCPFFYRDDFRGGQIVKYDMEEPPFRLELVDSSKPYPVPKKPKAGSSPLSLNNPRIWRRQYWTDTLMKPLQPFRYDPPSKKRTSALSIPLPRNAPLVEQDIYWRGVLTMDPVPPKPGR
ncbi:hypothetical protein IAU60_003693 [Kwoniella sp. DSM 27419]